ncbi:DUF4174 domain-containing protein [Mucilaginibacter terrae]|uniref:DUF4174 domain-containing protein n=1 Tax=Mucilaginibacter terrae TaxID=1955052 RepID=UPI00363C4313
MLKIGLIITLLTGYSSFQEKRQLLVFADNVNNSNLKTQQKILNADTDGLQERDIEVKFYYANRDKDKFLEKSIKLGFTVILVGKDGGDKLRSTSPFTLKKLYTTIDAMPMRQSEMKRHP